MKKSLLLGAAALAAVAYVPTADAGEVKLGGYYRFQYQNLDSTYSEDASQGTSGGTSGALNKSDTSRYRHRLNLKMDMIASEKSHAHMVFRPISDDTVSGAASFDDTGTTSATGNTAANGTTTRNWTVHQMWLETEAFGIGIKAGTMPMSLNDKILINDDGDEGLGGIMLSKTFGDVTGILGNIKVDENVTNMGSDDFDIYLASVLGKMGGASYNLTVAHAEIGENSTMATAAVNTANNGNKNGSENDWIALTVGGELAGIDLTGTVVYETGYDNVDISANTASVTNAQAEGSGFMTALRAKGKTGFGGWNTYIFYGDEDFDSINNRPNWSEMYASSSSDLMHDMLRTTTTGAGGAINANASGENTTGIGAGLTINAGDWKVNPQVDYIELTEDSIKAAGATAQTKANIDNAWGASLILSTNIDTGTSLSLIGQYVDPEDGDNADDATYKADEMSSLLAEIKIKF